MLSLKRGERLCISTGNYCSSKIPIINICLAITETYCCYNSRLARIIGQQGGAQLGIGTNCAGFTAAQLNQIDFSRINLTEFMADIQSKINIPAIQSGMQGRINSMGNANGPTSLTANTPTLNPSAAGGYQGGFRPVPSVVTAPTSTSPTSAPNCNLTPVTSVIAPNGFVILTARCPGATQFTWTGSGCAAVDTTHSTCTVSLPSGSQSYTVAGTNAVGTGPASPSATVTVMPPSCTLTANPSSIVSGESSTLTANCSPAASSYVWTGGTCVGSGSTCTVFPQSGSQTYTVTGVNAAGYGAAATATVTVAPLTPPNCTLTAKVAAGAVGGAYGRLEANCYPAATSYVWSANTGFYSTASGYFNLPEVTTIYTVTGVNAAGSGDVASTEVLIYSYPHSDSCSSVTVSQSHAISCNPVSASAPAQFFIDGQLQCTALKVSTLTGAVRCATAADLPM